MEEYPDELMAKYTRRELEAMAIDLEVDTMGLSTKSQFAEAIFEARRMIKETSPLSSPAKPSEMADPTDISEVARAEVVVPPMEAEMASPKEASAEKLPRVNIQVGVNGVLAKKAAIDEESRSMHENALAIQKAGQNMRQDGIKHMQSRVSEMQKAIDAQVKENERSLKNFDQGVEEIRIDIDKESRSMTKKALEIQKAGQKMRLDGIKQMQKNVGDFKAEIDEFVKVDMENYLKDFYYG